MRTKNGGFNGMLSSAHRLMWEKTEKRNEDWRKRKWKSDNRKTEGL